MTTRSLRRAALAATALVTLALPLAAPAGAAPAPAGEGQASFVPRERTGDVSVESRKDVRHAVALPRSIDVKHWRYTVDYDRDRFIVFIKATNLVRPGVKHGYTTVQYADVFVSYGREEAFALGTSNRRPNTNSGGADTDVVSRACARSVRNAHATTNFAKDTVRIAVSLDCVPVGQTIAITGWTSLWVNPANPPNTEVASDYLEGISFTRTAA